VDPVPSARWCSSLLCKKGPSKRLGKDYTQQFELWRWCLHLPDRPEPATLHHETYSFQKLK
jgi:hypothetical protein